MGFFGLIEREKQQRLQEELDKKREAENRILAKAKTSVYDETEFLELHRERVGAFLEDSRAVVELMGSLNQLGCIDYFKDVARVTYSDLKGIIFMRSKGGLGESFLYSVDFLTEFGRRYPKFVQQELESMDALGKRIIESNLWVWPRDRLTNPRTLGMVHHPDTQFFNDNSGDSEEEYYINPKHWTRRIVDMKGGSLLPETASKEEVNRDTVIRFLFPNSALPIGQVTNWFTEPKEVGVGFRISKLLKAYDQVKRDQECEIETTVHEEWWNAVYIRIRAFNQATLTGSVQRDVGISDIRLFDDVLEEVMRRPASTYIRNIKTINISRSPISDFG